MVHEGQLSCNMEPDFGAGDPLRNVKGSEGSAISATMNGNHNLLAHHNETNMPLHFLFRFLEEL